MTAFVTHFAFDFRTGVRNKTLLLMNYLFPLGFFVMMGLIMTDLNPFFLDAMVPAMVVFAVMAATLLGLPGPLVAARELGVFRSYKINGVPTPAIIGIPALTTTTHLIIVSGLITVASIWLFGAPSPTQWSGFVLTFLAVALASASISVLIGVVSSNSRIQVLWSQLVFLPSMILGGLMIPYDQLPEYAGRLARLLPATHAMNAFRGLAMGLTADFSAWGSLLALIVSGLLAAITAAYLFTWDPGNERSRGYTPVALVAFLPFLVMVFV